jgi:hypothetical protein
VDLLLWSLGHSEAVASPQADVPLSVHGPADDPKPWAERWSRLRVEILKRDDWVVRFRASLPLRGNSG